MNDADSEELLLSGSQRSHPFFASQVRNPQAVRNGTRAHQGRGSGINTSRPSGGSTFGSARARGVAGYALSSKQHTAYNANRTGHQINTNLAAPSLTNHSASSSQFHTPFHDRPTFRQGQRNATVWEHGFSSQQNLESRQKQNTHNPPAREIRMDNGQADSSAKHGRMPRKHYPLNFSTIKRMMDEDTFPQNVVQKFTEDNLRQFLDQNPKNWEVIELIIAVIGRFCEKNGVSLFHNAFIAMVSALAEKEIFNNVDSIILSIPKSRATNIGSTGERLSRFIKSIGHLTTEMLTSMPTLACNYLGEKFFSEIYELQNISSIRDNITPDVFNILQDGSIRLKNAWEQHSKAKENKSNVNKRKQNLEQRMELLSLRQPPDDFRQLSVMPEWEDVCTDAEPFLRPNIIKGNYPDVDTYLDVQFRLLREDFFNPLREGLLAYRKLIEKKQKRLRVDNVRLYFDVKIIEDPQANVYVLEFSTKGFQRINWEASKRLLFGSLLLLSNDGFNSFILFTVVDRKPDQLSRGRIKVKLEGDSSLPLYAKKSNSVMAESSVFFEAYRSILLALQRISPAHFPMEDYILCRNVAPSEPDYLRNVPDPIYDLTTVRQAFPKSSPEMAENAQENDEQIDSSDEDFQIPESVRRVLSHVSIFSEDTLPSAATLGLDPSQAKAFFSALTRKVVVIQGPPGTGKTYLGWKIVQTLLKNKKYWTGLVNPKPTPILVICYTNHALDQFLEGIMKFTQKIVRIGGQSKCAALEPFSLREWRRQATVLRKRPPQYRNMLFEARENLAKMKSVLEKRLQLQMFVANNSVVHEDSFLKLGILPKRVYQELVAMRTKSSTSSFSFWLGLESTQTLKEVIWTLKTLSKPESPSTIAETESAPPQNEEFPEEEEWDKEDLEEIEGQRMLNDDMGEATYGYLSTRKGSRPKGSETVNHEEISFAFSTAILEKKIASMDELIEQLEGDDIEITKAIIKEAEEHRELFKELLTILPVVKLEEFNKLIETDLLRLTYLERWKVYSYLKTEIVDRLDADISEIKSQFNQKSNEMKDVETIETAEIIMEADVVGITTTGAAKQRAMLEYLKSKIVVVEEAAEVLEAHIITSLTSSCEQLILIGDHQQLRPPTTVYSLAKDYHLDVSLFERLIMNGMEPCVLGVQHRMRPDIARLIVPAIYPSLKNHESVLRYRDTPGMAENVFFFAHAEHELGDESDQESRSHLNPYEADMALALARHLLMQGLDSSQVTILTTYSGQLLHLRKLRKNHAILQGVRISVVDNFQGEENDVIILSLVRSNEKANVGFLKTENRICVALSRAKRGFYLIGNMGNLTIGSKLWRQISEVLVSNSQIGPYFELQCGVHHTMIKATQVHHFPPEGGCFRKCLSQMPCGHVCPKICHVEDREHTKQKCHEKCMRTCLIGHPCPKKCYQDCNPCLTMMPKVILPCNHTQIMACYKIPEDEYCVTKVIKQLPVCKHPMELECSMPLAAVKCPELCGMLLDCDHFCDRICHKRSSHSKLPCTQPCRRSPCVVKHPCPKQCFEECGKCMIDVTKKLPCGHEGNIKCWVLPKDAYCGIKVEKILSGCQHKAFFDCSKSTDGYRCTNICGKLLCNDGHACRKSCFETCGPCNVQVERTLSCGHTVKTACHKDPLTIKCKFPKVAVLPSCGHKVEIACGDSLEEATCPRPCDTRLDCGHQCTELCHTKKDPHHQEYICKKVCGRKKLNCKRNHQCAKKCHEDCDLCNYKIERVLPCGHSQVAECHLNDEDIKCRILVNKTIPECRHQIRVTCSTTPSRIDCQEPCVKRLSCGHNCKKKCCEPCSASDCVEPMKLLKMSHCGHSFVKSCKDYRRSPAVSEDEMIKFLQVCPQACRKTLSCEHSCKGTCGECFNGRVHKACEEKCGRTLVCAHNCGVNCAVTCPPCKETCEYRCQHSRCRKKCSEPCVDCVEPCGWKCEHYSCNRKCYEPCDRPVCDKPCRKRLRCGHPCIGLCGEVCPPLCRVCNKAELTEFILYGLEEEEDSRFIYLEDCKHAIEVEGMDHWMEMKEEETREIQMKCCPRCKTIIRSCYRYGNQIKRNFSDIVEVKRKILRSRISSKEFAEKLLKKIEESNTLNSQLTVGQYHSITGVVAKGLKVIQDSVSPKIVKKTSQYKSFDDDTRFMFEVQVDIVERLLSLIKVAFKGVPSQFLSRNQPMNTTLLEDILNRALLLVQSLLRRDRFSTAEHQCFIAETGRLDLIQAFFSLKSVPNYNGNFLVVKENKEIEEILLKNVKPLRQSEVTYVKDTLRKMAQKLKTGLGISDVEREQIVKAMGLTQGHWFKCPNGHIYAIGECGGAMQESKCNECGAAVGGASHRLRSDNRLASEMDGARFASWSEQANDMGNFAFDD